MTAWMLPRLIAEWCAGLATALDKRTRNYLPVLVLGMVLSNGRRTVSSWLRAAHVGDCWQNYYDFLQTLGRRATHVASELLRIAVRRIPGSHVGEFVRLAIDDSPTKRYGPKVEFAGVHHNPTPGPSGSDFLYGHVWVTISWLVQHPLSGCIGLPLLAKLYIRRKDLEAAAALGKAPWAFRTKLELAAKLVEWCVVLFQNWFERPVMVIVDGAYAKRPFISRVISTGAVVVSRLRKDAALCDVPVPPKHPGKGRPRKYGLNRLSLAKRGAHRHGWLTMETTLYGKPQVVTYKTFLATYRPAGGCIRVVIVRRSAELFGDNPAPWIAFFSTECDLSAEQILSAVADRCAIEQNFHDVKEVHGSGQQQVRNVWSNVACWNLCLWVHTLIEIWAWKRKAKSLIRRDDRPWEDVNRRPSHADRLKTLRNTVLRETFSAIPRRQRSGRKIGRLFEALARLVT